MFYELTFSNQKCREKIKKCVYENSDFVPYLITFHDLIDANWLC
jgi:hypothetical protein